MGVFLENLTKEEKLKRLSGWILQEDAICPIDLLLDDELTPERYIESRFNHFPTENISAIIWDCGLESEAWQMYLKGTLPVRDVSTILRWAAGGIDYLELLESETRKRGMLALWNHRISEVDLPHPLNSKTHNLQVRNRQYRGNYLKRKHPDWVIPGWPAPAAEQGLWNLANPELRKHKVNVLREIAENYRLDGFQLDFARHTPCLPPGREWENREHATAFVREMRQMLDETAAKTGRPQLLLVRVGENLEGNHRDGLEVERWITEGIVDAVVLGGRTVNIDFEGFRNVPGSDKMKFIASWDAHHTGKGMHKPPLEYLVGAMGNFTELGAAGVSLFNSTEEKHQPYFDMLKLPFRKESFQREKREYRAERRGEYPWAGNYLYRCDDKPLPMTCASGGRAVIPLEIYSDATGCKLSVMIDNLKQGDIRKLELNGVDATETAFDPARPDQGDSYARKGDVPSYPAADYDIRHIPLKRGINRVEIQFGACGPDEKFTIINVFIKIDPAAQSEKKQANGES